MGIRYQKLEVQERSYMKNKKFDAVAMMREIRNKLSKKYSDNPGSEITDLVEIRKKYKLDDFKKTTSKTKLKIS